jgi:predicted NBD/HSP70 family sugar kinase/biotin operon repressor
MPERDDDGRRGVRADAAAEPSRVRAADLSRGTNQSGVRLYNERLVLSLIRRHGSLPKAEIARQTGLSAQTITVIMRQLESDGLVISQSRRRGKIGQPSIPFALNPDGAYSIGFKIGRRSTDLILMDLVGGVREALHRTYPFPSPALLLDFLREGCATIKAALPRDRHRRISGLGIATPFELWNWEEQVGAPHDVMQAWRGFDIAAEVEAISEWPVYLCNDATAACAAEFVFGNGADYLDFLYVFIGWFIGGGVVLNGSLYPGRRGYAGAIAALPIPMIDGEGRLGSAQMLRSASTSTLERRIKLAGGDPRPVWESPDDWSAIEGAVGGWIEEAAGALALMAVSAVSVIDFQAIVIDGAFPPAIRSRIVKAVNDKVERFDRQGLVPVEIVEGSIGSGARAIGGACLPLLANFARDREVLFKEAG